MSLQPDSVGLFPFGHFDMLDAELDSVKGGEVGALTSVSITADDAAADADDGYAGTTTKNRPAITKALTSGMRPLGLLDDGKAGYGTLYGKVVGGTAGKNQTGVELGPHTAFASGKVGFYASKGTYKVSLDAVDTTTGTGVNPDNSTIVPGAALYATDAGLLTPVSGDSFESNLVIARFLEFTTNGSLVTTPRRLVSAVNSPVGSTQQGHKFTEALIYFDAPVA